MTDNLTKNKSEEGERKRETSRTLYTATGIPIPKDDMPKALRSGKNFFVICMLFFPLLGFVVFYIIQNFEALGLAFQEIVGVDEYGNDVTRWTFDQFPRAIKLFKGSGAEMSVALKNTVLYFLSKELLMTPVSFVIAYFFYKKLTGTGFFRVAIYLPNIISSIALCTAFKCIIAPNGPLSDLLFTKFGYEMPSLLRQESTATYTIVFFQVFMGININMLLFQGSFNRIPKEVVEAALLDGAGAWVELVTIMIPMMWSTLSTLLLLSITNIFGSSGQILLFTGGSYGTSTISYWMYDQVKLQNSYNLPSALGLIFTFINIPIVVIVRWLSSKIEDVTY